MGKPPHDEFYVKRKLGGEDDRWEKDFADRPAGTVRYLAVYSVSRQCAKDLAAATEDTTLPERLCADDSEVRESAEIEVRMVAQSS